MSEAKQVNRLTAGLQFKLMQYVQAEYVSSGQTDQQFAERAAQALGHPVTLGNIQGCRDALEIPNNYSRERQQNENSSLFSLQQRVSDLEQQVETLLRERNQGKRIGGV